jgi:hypothetical protein
MVIGPADPIDGLLLVLNTQELRRLPSRSTSA